VGDSIQVLVNFTYAASGANESDRLRIGLLQSVANPNAISGNGFVPVGGAGANTNARASGNLDGNSGGTMNSHFANLYTGFTVARLSARTSAGAVVTPNVAFYERVPAAPTATGVSLTGASAATAGTAGFNTIATGGAAFTIGSNWFNGGPGSTRIPLTLAYTITYLGIDEDTGNKLINLAYSLTDGSIVNSFSNDHVTTGPLTFDTITLFSRSAYPEFDDITVTLTSAIPEPATYAALFGLSGLGLVYLRRRRG